MKMVVGGEREKMSDCIDKLIEKYPLVFKYMETATYSFLPEGWYKLLDETCSKIELLLKESYEKYPPDEDGIGFFRVEQIKEKMGTLRFYYSFHTEDKNAFDAIQDIVDRAELDSHDICEVTGKPGEICVAGMWFKTLSKEVRQHPDYKDYVPWSKEMMP